MLDRFLVERDRESVIRSYICISSNHRLVIYEIVHASLPGYKGISIKERDSVQRLVQELVTPLLWEARLFIRTRSCIGFITGMRRWRAFISRK